MLSICHAFSSTYAISEAILFFNTNGNTVKKYSAYFFPLAYTSIPLEIGISFIKRYFSSRYWFWNLTLIYFSFRYFISYKAS